MGGKDSFGKSKILINFAKNRQNSDDSPRESTEISPNLRNNYSALVLAILALNVEISGKVDFSLSFQWERSSLRKGL